MQTFTFYASDDKLENRGNKLTFTVREFKFMCCIRFACANVLLNCVSPAVFAIEEAAVGNSADRFRTPSHLEVENDDSRAANSHGFAEREGLQNASRPKIRFFFLP